MKKVFFYTVVILAITIALTGCLPKTVGQEPPLPVVNIKAILPENTPEDGTVYIVGNYSDWSFDSAATSTVKTDTEGNKYAEFELEILEFPLEYKYTIGKGWAYVEKGAEGDEIDNRVIGSAPEDVIIDTVASWAEIPTPSGEEPAEPPSEEPTIVKLKAILPENTPEDGTVYIVGNYSDWGFDNAATSTVKTDEGNKYAEFELEISQFPLKYKYTIGPAWEYVEKDAEGNEIGDRVIESEPEDVIIDTVARWAEIPTPSGEEPTEPPTEGEIIIDGEFSEWDIYDGAKTIVDDPDDDSKWGEENDVNWLGIAADEDYLYIGAQYKASENGFIVYISIDGDTTGATDMNFGGWSRAIKFDRNVQYFVASWVYQGPQLWKVEDTETKTEKSSLITDKSVKGGIGYEIKIPLSELGLASGDTIHFVGCIVGGDGASSPDTAPDNNYPENWAWNVELTITNMAELIIP